jgi:hypothetical protein
MQVSHQLTQIAVPSIIAAKRRRRDEEAEEVVLGVRSGDVTEPTLVARLQQHVEQIDVDMVSKLRLVPAC